MKRLLAALTTVMLMLLTACGSSGPATTPTAAPSSSTTVFTMQGTVVLDRGNPNRANVSLVDADAKIVPCHGRGGYDDLRVGAQVTVYDASGKVVGVGAVDSVSSTADKGCRLDWSVPNVPGGYGPYQYEVTHRGKLTITEADARAGLASASIGD